MSSAEIATVTEPITGVLATVADEYTREKIELVKQTVAQGATEAELAMFLRLADRYGLDPFAKEIWCICELDRDTGERKPGKAAQIMASRDGYLAIAQRNPAYAGLVSDAVYRGDRFERVTDSKGVLAGVRHEYDFDSRQGQIIGAYALVYRHDRIAPSYFFARWAEYGEAPSKMSWSPWAKYRSAMIIKVAEAVALRHAFSISGIAGEDELAGDVEAERPSYVAHLATLGRRAPESRALVAATPLDETVAEQAPATVGGAAPRDDDAASPQESPAEHEPEQPLPDSPAGETEPATLPVPADSTDDAGRGTGPTAPTAGTHGADDQFPGSVTDPRPITERQRSDLYHLVDQLGDQVMSRGDVNLLVQYATCQDDQPATRLAELSRTRYDQLVQLLRDDPHSLIRDALQWRRAGEADAQGRLA